MHPLVNVAFMHDNLFVHNSFRLWPCLFQDFGKSTVWSLLTPLRDDSRLPMFNFMEQPRYVQTNNVSKEAKSKNMYTNDPKWSHKEMQHISQI